VSAERSAVGTGILTAAIALFALGVVVMVTGNWRPGLALAGAGLDVAGLSRLVLSIRLAGPLRVRHSRLSDAFVMCALGTTLLVLPWLVPDQPSRAG
jgi:hypothetical protein